MNNGLVVRNIIFINRAPFKNLDLKFIDGVNVLLSENGRGKTTIMSYVVDALYEIAKRNFLQSFLGHERAFYRISSSSEVIDPSKISLVYVRFVYQGENVDYIDARGAITKELYETLPLPENPIPISIISSKRLSSNAYKFCHFFNQDTEKESVFSHHLATYFPAYRYELPAYLNDVCQPNRVAFNLEKRFNGILLNPIEVVEGISHIASWLLDVVLDWKVYEDKKAYNVPGGGHEIIDKTLESILWHNICEVLQWALLAKTENNHIRFGIGRRHEGDSRVSVMSDRSGMESEQISPSISYLSSGEKGLLCIFGEILRQADCIHPNIQVDQIDGLVMVDEIDKHLHIRQQKEALPRLLNNFINVQFIVSSHSPFLNMGLADYGRIPCQIIDLDAGGVTCAPRNNQLYQQVYELILHERAELTQQVDALQKKVASITKPIILTEGKTDWKHIKHALIKLQEQGEFLDIDVAFDEFEMDRGDSKLQNMCTLLAQLPNTQKIIAIYDTDKDAVQLKGSEVYKKTGGSVYELPIPNPQGYSCGISIEMMYPESDIKRVDANNRRLYLTSEFNPKTGALLGGTLEKNCRNNALKDAAKNSLIKIIDKEVYDVTTGFDHALSKEAYAMYILNDDPLFTDVDVSGFRELFELIKRIIND